MVSFFLWDGWVCCTLLLHFAYFTFYIFDRNSRTEPRILLRSFGVKWRCLFVLEFYLLDGHLVLQGTFITLIECNRSVDSRNDNYRQISETIFVLQTNIKTVYINVTFKHPHQSTQFLQTAKSLEVLYLLNINFT